MTHIFSYIKIDDWYRPVIPITLKNGTTTLRYMALIDSGADLTIFHGDIAKILGIDLKKIKKAVSFGGIKDKALGKGYISEVNIGVRNEFAKTKVIFSPDISDNGYGILGQQGFFENYKVEFDFNNKKIIVGS